MHPRIREQAKCISDELCCLCSRRKIWDFKMIIFKWGMLDNKPKSFHLLEPLPFALVCSECAGLCLTHKHMLLLPVEPHCTICPSFCQINVAGFSLWHFQGCSANAMTTLCDVCVCCLFVVLNTTSSLTLSDVLLYMCTPSTAAPD